VGKVLEPEDLDEVAVVGVVPTDGRGSWPFALLHGESLVAVASWALGEAGAGLADFTASWAEVRASEALLVVHDPLCPATPVPFLASAVRECVRTGAVVVGARPVTDTVVRAAGEELGDRVDREALRAVCSPVVLPAAVVAALPDWPPLTDLAELVVALADDHDVTFLEAPPAARRVADDSDLRVLEALEVSD
jgi:2-C-methyl-D-erythritol 4-phosphate cytidylyltransferase